MSDKKEAAFFDLDNTLIKGSSLFYFVKGLVQHGEVTKRSIAKLAYQHFQYKRTKTETDSAIQTTTQKVLEFVKGKTHLHLNNICQSVVEEFFPRIINPRVVEEVEKHKSEGRDTWIVTASPIEIAEIVSKKLGMNGGVGTVGEVINEKYSGKLDGNPLHGFSKAVKIRQLAALHAYDLENSYAYSDSINDLPLLASVGNPHIVNPNKELQILAEKNNWPILDSA